MIDLLIDYGADVNCAAQDGDTYLHTVCYLNNVRVVKLLLNKGVEIDARDILGRTPLYIAICYSTNETTLKMIVEVLVTNGANVDTSDYDGNTPLHRASIRKHLSIVNYLLENGADPNAMNNEGNTPYHYAIWNEQKHLADLLLKYGADVHMRNNHCESAVSMRSTW
ncbi:hypothetical protein CAPTEDRAFT_98474, partial [Capitella teleta]